MQDAGHIRKLLVTLVGDGDGLLGHSLRIVVVAEGDQDFLKHGQRTNDRGRR